MTNQKCFNASHSRSSGSALHSPERSIDLSSITCSQPLLGGSEPDLPQPKVSDEQELITSLVLTAALLHEQVARYNPCTLPPTPSKCKRFLAKPAASAARLQKTPKKTGGSLTPALLAHVVLAACPAPDRSKCRPSGTLTHPLSDGRQTPENATVIRPYLTAASALPVHRPPEADPSSRSSDPRSRA